MTTMQIDRAVVEQALEALESVYGDSCDALHALRAALAQQAEPVQDQRCRAEPRSDGDFVCDCKIGECPGRSAEPAQEPVAWKQGNLVTFNEDPYPALGGLFVQFWDGEEVAARVYANDLETIRQRCAKVNTAPPQQVAQQAEPLNLSDPAVQKRLATQWGYVPAAQAEPVEPVYKVKVTSRWHDTEPLAPAFSLPDGEHLLYTAPPQRKPLPKHDQHCVDVPGYGLMAVRLVRAVERAHGIKE